MSDFLEMEPSLCDAANFSTALAMALEGIDKLAIEDADQIRGLKCLAAEVMYAALRARAIWYEEYPLWFEAHQCAKASDASGKAVPT